MKKLVFLLPVIAGCDTAPVASVNPREVEALRAEVSSLRADVDSMKSESSYRKFLRGRRAKKPEDLRKDLPKGVAR